MERINPYADSPLLMEVHTRFPALLYDSARFRSLQDVFRYVQSQLRSQYDVFSNSQRAFQANDPVYQARQYSNTVHETIQVPVPGSRTFDPSSILTEVFGQVAMNDPFARLIFPFYQPATTNNDTRTPPTREQIRASTLLHSQTADSETPCAVCQDSIVSNDIVRKLNGCNHIFHADCIDTWLQRSSLCPTCRHDITILPPAP